MVHIIIFLLTCLFWFMSVPLSFANAVPFNEGDIITGTNGGKLYHYSSTGTRKDTLQTELTGNNIAAPLCFDSQGNLRVSNSLNNTISEFSTNGILVNSTWGGPYNGLPMRCVSDSLGNFYVYTSEIFGATNLIRKFTQNGSLVKTYQPEYDTNNTGTVFARGLYSMALKSDNCTMLYTSVQSLDATHGSIKQFNVCSDTQLPDFAQVPTPSCTDIRIRSNGEVITACGKNIYRLAADGAVLKTYEPVDSKTFPAGNLQYSLDLSSDTIHFLAGGNYSGNVYKVHMETGEGADQPIFSVPLADPVWNTLVGLLAVGSASNPTEPTPSPTVTPIPSVSPPQEAPEPFLDLPWDYRSQGKRFEEVAFNPNAWFDHAYPLQNVSCCIENVRIYSGQEIQKPYRSHSGYDYGLVHGVKLNTPVLAAADGWATFEPESETGGGGNMIKIDHGNGYQTWYEHLMAHGLIVSQKGEKIFVSQGQKIGETGFTGNAFPQDKNGAHIHFSVFKDINTNGSFEDDYPYGLVDPLGWEGDYPDPWTQYGSGNKKGAASYNLFLARAKPKETIVTKNNGGNLSIEDTISVSIPPEALPIDVSLLFKDGPFISETNRTSVTPSFFLNAFDALGQTITQFYKPVRIVYYYSRADLMNIQENTLLLYYLNEATNNWEPLQSTINTTDKTITAETNHFSHFAVMGKVKDQTPPTTSILLNGEKGNDDFYRSDVSVIVHAKDNHGGLGIDSTVYKIDNQDWQLYTKPFAIASEGAHTISYMSVDKADNRESIQTKRFIIDRTYPEAHITYDLNKYDFKVHGKDGSAAASVTEKKSSSRNSIVSLTDFAGNTTKVIVEKSKLGKQGKFSVESIQYGSNKVLVDSNVYYISLDTDRKDSVTHLMQYIVFKNDKRIYTQYVSKTNKTEIYTKTVGNRYQKTEKPGLVLLQLFTENGKLKYGY